MRKREVAEQREKKAKEGKGKGQIASGEVGVALSRLQSFNLLVLLITIPSFLAHITWPTLMFKAFTKGAKGDSRGAGV